MDTKEFELPPKSGGHTRTLSIPLLDRLSWSERLVLLLIPCLTSPPEKPGLGRNSPSWALPDLFTVLQSSLTNAQPSSQFVMNFQSQGVASPPSSHLWDACSTSLAVPVLERKSKAEEAYTASIGGMEAAATWAAGRRSSGLGSQATRPERRLGRSPTNGTIRN